MPMIKRKRSLRKRLFKGFEAYRFKGKTKTAKKIVRLKLIVITIAVLFVVIACATLAAHSNTVSPPPPVSSE